MFFFLIRLITVPTKEGMLRINKDFLSFIHNLVFGCPFYIEERQKPKNGVKKNE